MRRYILLVLLIAMLIALTWQVWPTTPAPAPDNNELALNLAKQIDQHFCGMTMIHSAQSLGQDTGSWVYCELSAGHETYVYIKWFTSRQDARAEFTARRQISPSTPISYVYGYPAAMWTRNAPFPDGATLREMVWYADTWVFFISSFDDTFYKNALDPQLVTEVLYDFALEAELFRELPIHKLNQDS